MSSKLKKQPENDPWSAAARRDPSGEYKVYCYQHHDAARMSWRRLKKLDQKSFPYCNANRSPMGRAEQRISAALERAAGDRGYSELAL